MSVNIKPPLVVGINGQAKVGKDTIAKMVSLSLERDSKLSVKLIAFADRLKEAASLIFGIPLEQFYDQDAKEEVNKFWNMSPRQMIQKLGTDACRDGIRDDIWLKVMEKTIKDSNADIIIITDVRFDNEAEFVKNVDGYGIVVNITRDNHSQIKDSNHASEKGIKDSLKDRVVVNIDGNPFIAAASVLGIILNAYYTSTGQISKLVVAG